MDTPKLKTTFDGREITYSPLKPTQISMLPMLKFSKDEARSAHLIFRVIEGAVGPEEWERIEDSMFLGRVDFEQFMALFAAMATGTGEYLTAQAGAPVDDVAEEIRKAKETLARYEAPEGLAE